MPAFNFNPKVFESRVVREFQRRGLSTPQARTRAKQLLGQMAQFAEENFADRRRIAQTLSAVGFGAGAAALTGQAYKSLMSNPDVTTEEVEK